MAERRTPFLRWAGSLGILTLFLVAAVLYRGGGNTVILSNESGQVVQSIVFGSRADIEIQGSSTLRDVPQGAVHEVRVDELGEEGYFYALAILADGTVLTGNDGEYHTRGTEDTVFQVRVLPNELEVR